jgi:hypothetical protein
MKISVAFIHVAEGLHVSSAAPQKSLIIYSILSQQLL